MSGFRIGHWTDDINRTGCTVAIFDQLVPAVCDVRGGAPATRETDLLSAERLVGQVDAILLTGGSAFGLAAADGVMTYLREQGRGWPTHVMPVPIVPTAALFDLGVGNPVWPNAEAGYSACLAAVSPELVEIGQIGAGTGATYRKLWPDFTALPGGFGYASILIPGGPQVHALVAINAVGDVRRAGVEPADRARWIGHTAQSEVSERESTTLGIVIVEGSISKRGLRRLTVAAHDAYARLIVPSHTLFDGDIVFAAALHSSAMEDPMTETQVALATELAMEAAIRSAVERQ